MPVKSTLFILLAVLAFSVIILLVDRYFFVSPIWWMVAMPIFAGSLYLRLNRDQSPTNNAPPDTLSDPETGRRFTLNDVVKIEVETTGNGPFDEDLYWIFHLQSAPRVRMAGGVAQGLGIFDVLERFDGVHYENAVQSASTVTAALFPIWEKD